MVGELRIQIKTDQHNMVVAGEEGLPFEAHLHLARLEDLIEMASRHGIDITEWIDTALLPPPTSIDG